MNFPSFLYYPSSKLLFTSHPPNHIETSPPSQKQTLSLATTPFSHLLYTLEKRNNEYFPNKGSSLQDFKIEDNPRVSYINAHLKCKEHSSETKAAGKSKEDEHYQFRTLSTLMELKITSYLLYFIALKLPFGWALL